MHYKWDNKRGVLDENGNQVLQLVVGNCSKKFRNTAGKELVNKLNTIERGKAATIERGKHEQRAT